MNQGSHRLTRRSFCRQLGASVPAALVWGAGVEAARGAEPGSGLRADLVVVGGGLGGCAAALAAARRGCRVILTEETDWIGGQLTSQAVPSDENRWIETHGASGSYQELRRLIREHYRRLPELTAAARANPLLNPGNGTVSRLCHEPRAALSALHRLLEPWEATGAVRRLERHRLVSATMSGDRVQAVAVLNLQTGQVLHLEAPTFVDATELGDLLPATGAEYVTGSESRAQTGEPHAKDVPLPGNHQAFTCCFAMEYLAGEDHTLDRPAEYAFWRDYVPALTPPWSGRLLSLTYSNPRTLQPHSLGFDPERGTGLFRYRRILDRTLFHPGAVRGDLTLVNWPQNDYLLGTLIDVSPAEADRHIARAKQLSLSLLYWLQTEAPRPDGGTGWKGLRLRPDVVGTTDGLAKAPYVRESRRIRALCTVTENHVSRDVRERAAGPGRPSRAERFDDSVGIGSYAIDLHPTCGGFNYIDFETLPFQIPLGALLPVRVENLLAGAKNVGTTHLTNGCYRLHPVEWSIGEAAGALASFSRRRGLPPRAVRERPAELAAFQAELRADGARLEWPAL